MNTDYLIIGQGLSGTILAQRLIEEGKDFLILDKPQLSKSSKIAAGLVNPVVLKRLKLIQDADKYLDAAQEYYDKYNAPIQDHKVAHSIHDVEELNHWMSLCGDDRYKRHLSDEIIPNTNEHIIAPLGLGIVKSSYWLNTTQYLSEFRAQHSDLIIDDKFQVENWKPEQKTLLLDDQTEVKYNKIIDCSGYFHCLTEQAKKKIFNPARGEILIIESTDLDDKFVYHSSIFTLPIGNNRYKVCSTYAWDVIEDVYTPEGRKELEEKFSKLFKGSYKVIDQMGAVRPAIDDRKPILGTVDAENAVYSFNGMGSRAVLMAPALSLDIIKHIESTEALAKDIDIQRFFKKN